MGLPWGETPDRSGTWNAFLFILAPFSAWVWGATWVWFCSCEKPENPVAGERNPLVRIELSPQYLPQLSASCGNVGLGGGGSPICNPEDRVGTPKWGHPFGSTTLSEHWPHAGRCAGLGLGMSVLGETASGAPLPPRPREVWRQGTREQDIRWVPSRPFTGVTCPQQPRAVGMDYPYFRAVGTKLTEVQLRCDRAAPGPHQTWSLLSFPPLAL